jgi:hypothetical protein
MAPAKKRRRLPTLINRGLGLIEVILPRGGSESIVSPLPEGRRDDAGFWYPVGYDQPADIFTPQQRRLQEKQRAIQRDRRRRLPPVDAAVLDARTTLDNPKSGTRDTAGPPQAATNRDQGAGVAAAPGTPAIQGPPAAQASPAARTSQATQVPPAARVSPAAEAIPAILTGGFGLREVQVPDPGASSRPNRAHRDSRRRTAATAAGRRVDSTHASE